MSVFKRLFNRGKEEEYRKLIFELYYPKAYNAAYYYCGDTFLAEEAAQDAIFKAITNIDQLRDPDKIEAWIKSIAVNNIISLLRKKKKVVGIDNVAMLADSKDNMPEYVLDTQETRNAIMAAIDTLDMISKQVIHLRFYEELKVKDIAVIMDKPEGTIKTLIHRAKNTIKIRLVAEGYIEQTGAKGGKKVE
ncbi:RNA polymerase sigma factor [Peptococcaceae bacterium 1198_IL3148]